MPKRCRSLAVNFNRAAASSAFAGIGPQGSPRSPPAKRPSRCCAPASARGRQSPSASAPPEPPFTDDGRDDRNARGGKGLQASCYGFGLRVLLRRYARIGAFGVDEGDDRQAQTRGELCQAACLAISFRRRHAEVAVQIFLGVAPSLLADAPLPVVSRKSAKPPTIDGSSRKWRSPWSSSKRSKREI